MNGLSSLNRFCTIFSSTAALMIIGFTRRALVDHYNGFTYLCREFEEIGAFCLVHKCV